MLVLFKNQNYVDIFCNFPAKKDMLAFFHVGVLSVGVFSVGVLSVGVLSVGVFSVGVYLDIPCATLLPTILYCEPELY
jgi:hypothetical protein